MTVGGEPERAATPPAEPHDDYDESAVVSGSLGRDAHAELLPRRGPLRQVFHALGRVEEAVGTFLIAVILILVLIQVAQRYVPGGGWPWTGEVARLALVWCTFILSGYLMAFDRHMSIQLIDFVLPPRALAVVKLLVHGVVIATCVAMTYATYRLIADDIGQRTAAAEIPLAWVYVLPMIGFALTALRAGMAIVLLDLPRIVRREGIDE